MRNITNLLAAVAVTAMVASPAHAQRGKPRRQEGGLLEREQVLPGEPDVLLLRHAVLAAEVAAVGHREPQRAQGSPQLIAKWGRCHACCHVRDGSGKRTPPSRMVDAGEAGIALPAGASPREWAAEACRCCGLRFRRATEIVRERGRMTGRTDYWGSPR